MGQADTIFALATAAGRTALAVMRLSGPGTGAMLEALCGCRPPARRASLRTLRDANGETIDRAIVLWLPGPGSYTGEDSAELHLHGGAAVISAAAEALARLGGRPAEPGEFSRRAFLNGRMDLIEAEAVADLVEAETAAQRRQALRQLEGELGALYRDWAARLLALLARQEALIDFPDESLPQDVEGAVCDEMARLRAEIAAHVNDGRRGERLREGLVFAVVGAPNAGKSTLVNALAERDVAIVSPQPGTTRDAIETRIVLGGVPVTLVDTAGLRQGNDAIEAEGVRRALARAAAADLVVLAVDLAAPAADPELPSLAAPVLRVGTKLDLARGDAPVDLAVCALRGVGLEALRQQLGQAAQAMTQANGPPPLTRTRHRLALGEAAAALGRAAAATVAELRAEDLRLAWRALGRITGAQGVEDVLDSVFRQFCIGK